MGHILIAKPFLLRLTFIICTYISSGRTFTCTVSIHVLSFSSVHFRPPSLAINFHIQFCELYYGHHWPNVVLYFRELLLPGLWPPPRFWSWRTLLSQAVARCVKNLKRRARGSWSVATLFACPCTTTFGAYDQQIGEQCKCCPYGPNYLKNIPLIEVCGTILHIWWTWCSCINHECHWHVLFW